MRKTLQSASLKLHNYQITQLPNSVAEVAGFVNAPNNGSFQIVSVNGTTLVLANAAGVAETHAATVVPGFPVDSRVSVPIDSRLAGNIPQNSRA